MPSKPTGTYSRRKFNKLCLGAASCLSVSSVPAAHTNSVSHTYSRVCLVDTLEQPLRPGMLEAGVNYLFYYPYISTPCFLLDLGQQVDSGAQLATADGRTYQSYSGVGPDNSIVAFSAICSHKLSYPTRTISFINYRHQNTSFIDRENKHNQASSVIHCCSERSVYDASQGAAVMGGPAPQPLSIVTLEYKDNKLFATGTRGAEVFERFFDEFGYQLALEHESTAIRRQVTETSRVFSMSEYCRNQILC